MAPLLAAPPASTSVLKRSNTYLALQAARECAAEEVAALREQMPTKQLAHHGASAFLRPTANRSVQVTSAAKVFETFKPNGRMSTRPRTPCRDMICPTTSEEHISEQESPNEAKDSLFVTALSPRMNRLGSNMCVGAILSSPLKKMSGVIQGHNVDSKYRLPPQRQTHGDEIKTLYHITSHGEDIKNSREMHPGSKGIVGGGIYFASTLAICKRKCLSDGWLVKARVLTGKAKTVQFCDASRSNMIAFLNQYTSLRLNAEGFDSIRVTGLRTGDEYVVYSKDQVEILKVGRLSTLNILDWDLL